MTMTDRSPQVATAGDAGQIRVWDPRTGRTWLMCTLPSDNAAIAGMILNGSPDLRHRLTRSWI